MAAGNIRARKFDKSMVDDEFKPYRVFLEALQKELAKRKPYGKVIKWRK